MYLKNTLINSTSFLYFLYGIKENTPIKCCFQPTNHEFLKNVGIRTCTFIINVHYESNILTQIKFFNHPLINIITNNISLFALSLE